MKKQFLNCSKAIAALCVIAGTSLCATPSFAGDGEKDKAEETSNLNNTQETNRLINQLRKDGIISDVKGFVIDKKGNALYINGQQQPAAITTKYLPGIRQKDLHVEVAPFSQRLIQHPGINILQLADPVMFSSPCVKYTPPPKDGC